MLDFLRQLGIDPYALLETILVATLVLTIAYRRFIFNIFDPLCLFLTTLVADSALMMALPSDTSLKWEFVSFTFFLWAGFALRGRLPATYPVITFSRKALFELEFVLFALFLVIVIGNLYLGASTGFPLLSLHPSKAKVADFTGGLGIVRRIDMGPYDFFSSGCLLLAFIGHKRRFVLSILFLATFLVVLDGSKSVLLPIIFALAFLLAHHGVKKSRGFKTRVTKYTLAILALGISVAVLVKVKDTGSLYGGILGFFKRLVLAGDVIIYYFPKREEMITLVRPDFWGYIQNLFSDFLGMLRLVPYQPALGSIILGSDNGFGPNVQYFVQADLFFSPIGGMLYCLILGYVIASLRLAFFKRKPQSAVWLSFKLMLAAIAFSLAIDSGLFVTPVMLACMLVLPLWVIARLIWISASQPLAMPDHLQYVDGGLP